MYLLLYHYGLCPLSRLLINSDCLLNIYLRFRTITSALYLILTIVNSVLTLLGIQVVIRILSCLWATQRLASHEPFHRSNSLFTFALLPIPALLLAFVFSYAKGLLVSTFIFEVCAFLHNFLTAYLVIEETGACTTSYKSMVSIPETYEQSKVPFVSYVRAIDSDELQPPTLPPNSLRPKSGNSKINNISPRHKPIPSILKDKVKFKPQIKEDLEINWDMVDFRVYSVTEIFEEDDEIETILVPDNFGTNDEDIALSLTAYKRVDKKIKPVSTTFPEEARVRRQLPFDPLETLMPLSKRPPKFVPTPHITKEQLETLNINPDNFLSKEEEKLFIQVMMNNEEALAFIDKERGTLKESYFSPYIMPVVPHTPRRL